MSANYRPDLRELAIHCWAEGSWLPGRIFLPTRRGLLDHLNQKDPFLKLRDVALSEKRDPLPFLALRRDSVSLLVPPPDETVTSATGTSTQHRVVCLLRGAILTGTLETLASLRVSDFLMRAPGFFAVGMCTIRMAGTPTLPFANPAATVLVNSERVIGVAQKT